ncbi:MAG: NAD(P)H-dependent oxidoreductase subunit E, partial [Gammaproteobacteria bacterium]|nr:NAD(P)H-dependent oxidoreductase subunit E [Gammaproteobacteria bacterium]
MSASSHGTPAQVHKRRHPGSGKRRAARTPKGRQLDPQALEEVRELLGDRPRQRDLLIEHLHLIQDRFHHLSARHLAALAHEMGLPMAAVYEVASFYAHFDVVREDEPVPAPVTIRVCDSLSCALAGAEQLLQALQTDRQDTVRVVRAPCMGRCAVAPAVEVGHRHIERASVDAVQAALQAEQFEPQVPNYQDLDGYRAEGGYAVLQRCLAGELQPEQLIEMLNDAGLRGLGGAGFPTGRKWSIVRGYVGPRLMAVNADEGEPGTFKDRHYLESKPHRFLEGMLIAAWVVEAQAIYIYLRDEYPAVRELLQAELEKLRASGLCAHVQVNLRRGAGAYICGEESAMLESIEGKRGLPRHRPPYVAERGIFDRPTLVQNVETLYWLPEIIGRGPEWFASQGRNGGRGLRSYSVSGRVREPGVKLAPAGVSVRELIDEFC